MKCTLIIPTYNESPVIAQTLTMLAEAFHTSFESTDNDWDICVVDNASTDGTAEVVERMKHPNIRVMVLKEKGKGRAIRAGFRATTSEVVGFTDADLAVSPDDVVNAFRRVLQEHIPLLIGSRVHAESKQPNRGWWRVLSSRLFNIGIRCGVGINARDTQCPLKVMDIRVRDIFLGTSENTWFFDFEFITIVERLHIPICEVPVEWDEHRYPDRESKLSTFRDGIRTLGAIVRIRSRLPEQLAKFRKIHNMDTL